MKTAVLLLGAAIPFITGGCGTRAGTNIDAAVAATTDACQHTCTPDPLPPLVNCGAAEAGLEFFETPIGTFDEPNASYLYSYTDESQRIRSFEVDGQEDLGAADHRDGPMRERRRKPRPPHPGGTVFGLGRRDRGCR